MFLKDVFFNETIEKKLAHKSINVRGEHRTALYRVPFTERLADWLSADSLRWQLLWVCPSCRKLPSSGAHLSSYYLRGLRLWIVREGGLGVT